MSSNLKEVVYPSWDKQYFDSSGNLIKTILQDWIIIDFSWRTKKVSRSNKITTIDNDDLPF